MSEIRGTGFISAMSSIGSAVKNFATRALEATISSVFHAIIGSPSKTESTITPVTVHHREAVHTSSGSQPTLLPNNAGLKDSSSHQVSSSQIKGNNQTSSTHGSVEEYVPDPVADLKETISRVVDKFKDTSSKNLSPDVRLESFERQRGQLQEMQASLRNLRRNSPMTDSEAEKMSSMISDTLRELGAKIREIKTRNDSSRQTSTSPPTHGPSVTPASTEAKPPTKPPSLLAKYLKGNEGPPEKMRALAKAFQENRANLPTDDLHAFARFFIDEDKKASDLQGKEMSPLQIWQKVGKTPGELSQLVIDTLTELENRGAAPAA